MADNDNNRKRGWKKYFKVASAGGQLSPISGQNQFGLDGYPRQTGDGYGAGGDHAGDSRDSTRKLSLLFTH